MPAPARRDELLIQFFPSCLSAFVPTCLLDNRLTASDQTEKRRPANSATTVALVTGTLAEPSLRRVADELARTAGIRPLIIELNIQVAALMRAEWVLRKLQIPAGAQIDRVVLPGHCKGDLEPIAAKLGVPVQRGPLDLRDLPELFGEAARSPVELDAFDVEIIAEINDAAHLPLERICAEALALRAAGADMIDLGCDPNVERPPWEGVADVVKALRGQGLRVSVDSFHTGEVEAACGAGAELVLSVNSTNREAARDWGVEVVAIPDTPQDLASLDRTLEHLERQGVPRRIDPIVEPIGFDFAASLGRYLEVRRRYPRERMMMGIGNLTELTECDSAGVNMLLLGFCQELRISSVLTTQVINWSRTAVREIDLARRIVHHAVTKRTAPKHLDERLVMLRDAKLRPVDPQELRELASRLTDDNIRIFADTEHGKLHAMNRKVHAEGEDPFDLFDKLGIDDPSHAFYLGYEMAKALTAMTLGKNYTQDEALDWGLLTKAEVSHFERRKGKTSRPE
jgi:dihydropteroate synthase